MRIWGHGFWLHHVCNKGPERVTRPLWSATSSGMLAPDRQARLEAISDWTWDPYETDWEEGFKRLRRFVKREGRFRMRRDYQDQDGYRLGEWVRRQVKAYQKGKLDPERRARLEALPGWTWDARKGRVKEDA
jgi:Helicase associated domain